MDEVPRNDPEKRNREGEKCKEVKAINGKYLDFNKYSRSQTKYLKIREIILQKSKMQIFRHRYLV